MAITDLSSSLGTAVLKPRPSTDHHRTPSTDTSPLSSVPDLPTTTEKQQQPPTVLPASASNSGTTTPAQNDDDNADEEPPFSIYTRPQKTLIALAASIAAMFSTMSSFIYYPALTRISEDMGVSLMLVQLTITSYLIVAGVAPAFMGDMVRPLSFSYFSLLALDGRVG
jgi:hypothetical protein